MKEPDEAVKAAMREFDSLFPSDLHVAAFLVELLKEHKMLVCKFCGSEDLELDTEQIRTVICRCCKRRIFFTKDSGFAYSKKLREFMGINWLFGHGFMLSNAELARIFNLAWDSVDGMVKKLQTAVEKSMPDDAETIDSAEFLVTYIRRSIRTPNNEHPSAEQRVVDEKTKAQDIPSPEKASLATDGVRPEVSEILNNFLCETPISFDALAELTGLGVGELSAALMILELSGLVRRLPGDRYKANPIKAPPKDGSDAARRLAHCWIAKCRSVCVGISRKYVQKYLAGFWCYLDRQTWHFASLTKAIASHRNITRKELMSYDSPPFIKLEGMSFMHG